MAFQVLLTCSSWWGNLSFLLSLKTEVQPQLILFMSSGILFALQLASQLGKRTALALSASYMFIVISAVAHANSA